MSEPTIAEFLDLGKRAVQGTVDKNADFIRGSDYEALLGPSAIIWSRQMQRDVDLFDACNFNTAQGDDLTQLVFKRWGKDRLLDSRGSGRTILRRIVGGVAETIWAGTRLFAFGDNPKVYRTLEDTPVTTTDLYVELAAEAVESGPGYAINILDPGAARVEDVLKDSSWYVSLLQCGDGTVFEQAPAFRARVRQELLDERVGQATAIIAACKELGASQIALFRSDYAGDAYDYGLNFCYVGNLGNVGTPELVKACTLALRSKRVAGDNLQVLPLAQVDLAVTADVYITPDFVDRDLSYLERRHRSALEQYLNGGAGRFGYTLDGLRTAITRFTPEVQRVVLTTPAEDDAIVTGDMKNFPDVLNRYVAGLITLRYH